MSFSTPFLGYSQAEAIYNEIATNSGNYYHVVGGADPTITNPVVDSFPMAPDNNLVTNKAIRRNFFAGKRISSSDVCLATGARTYVGGLNQAYFTKYDDRFTTGIIGIDISNGGSSYSGTVNVSIAEPFTATALADAPWTDGKFYILTAGTYYKCTSNGLTHYYQCVKSPTAGSNNIYYEAPRHTVGELSYNTGAILKYVGTRATAEPCTAANGCILNGQIIKVIIKEQGKGYTPVSNIAVTFTPTSTGSGAVAIAITNQATTRLYQFGNTTFDYQTDMTKANVFAFSSSNYSNARDMFICLGITQAGNANATSGNLILPQISDSNRLRRPFKYVISPGYEAIWQYVYTLDEELIDKFSSNDVYNYIPKEQSDGGDAFIPGIVCSIQVVSGGYGYTSAPTVEIIGNGSGCTATAHISNSRVTHITIDYNQAGIGAHGSNYTHANVVISGGGGQGASARAILGPAEGWGARPAEQLFANNVIIYSRFHKNDMFYDFQYSINSQGIKDITLLKNPTRFGSNKPFTGDIYMPCHYISATTNLLTWNADTGVITSDYETGDTLVQGTDLNKKFKVMAGARYNRLVDNTLLVQSLNDHNPVNGLFTKLADGTIPQNPSSFTVGGVANPNVNRFSGQILYTTKFNQTATTADNIVVARTVLVF